MNAPAERSIDELLEAVIREDAGAEAAAEALGRLGSPAARAVNQVLGGKGLYGEWLEMPHLPGPGPRGPGPISRRLLVGVLTTLARPSSVLALKELLLDEDAQVRVAAVEALEAINTEAAHEALCLACGNSAAAVRVRVAGAVARLRLKKAVESLCASLNHHDRAVRQAFGEALVEIANPPDEALWSAMHALHDETAQPKPLPDPFVLPHLMLAITHGSAEVRRRAVAWVEVIALRCPTQALSGAHAALYDCRPHPGWETAADVEERARVMGLIRRALGNLSDLPLTASAPAVDPDGLPLVTD